MRMVLFAVLLAGAAGGAAAAPGEPASQAMICPIGGAPFDYALPARTVPLGERPDGKPYGAAMPPPLPECPDNGLVLYKDYDAAEVAKLEPLVASPAYQTLRKDDTQYYRAYWLMREMGLGPEDYLWVLLQASWQADGKPELRARYLAEFAEASGKVAPDAADLKWVGMEGRSINALRELGRFDEALARLDRVPAGTFDESAASASAATRGEVEGRRRWAAYFRNLRTVVARKDASPEPLELLPRSVALARCADESAKPPAEPSAFCTTEAAAVAEIAARRATEAQELESLRQSRERSGR